jgi:two-component system phosphate regulon response regulator PhoB
VLAYNLEAEGYAVRRAHNGEEAMTFIDEAAPDLIFLDWMMPLLSGIEVCRRVKSIPQTRDIPVLMLNARTEEVDAVRGLDTGADEYVIKPYNLRELMARVRSQLRRARPATGGDVPRYKDIELNAQTHRVSCGESDVKLGPTKYRLLVTFLEKQGRVLSRD